MKVGVIDYGVGNIASVMRAVEVAGLEAIMIDVPTGLRRADRLVLPGVGNFADCARLLNAGGWRTALLDEVLGNERPLLGICLGMQLLGTASTEGAIPGNMDPAASGLGLVPGRVECLDALGCRERLPHVGWNGVVRTVHSGALFQGIPDGTDFYFVHRYAFVADSQEHVIATTDYGIEVAAAVRNGHVFGTQFHPEKSSRAGIRLIRNFATADAC